MPFGKPILCLDFDGVIHSYESGWKGPRTIPDPPVPGALEFIVEALAELDVQVFSSRSRYFGGRRAMRQWLVKSYCGEAPNWQTTPDYLRKLVSATAFADPWRVEVLWAVRRLVKRIGFPKHKPPAMVTLDDRALCFDGRWPALAELHAFQPWNKRAS